MSFPTQSPAPRPQPWSHPFLMDNQATSWDGELWFGGLVPLLANCDSEQVASSPWHSFLATKQRGTALSLRAPLLFR